VETVEERVKNLELSIEDLQKKLEILAAIAYRSQLEIADIQLCHVIIEGEDLDSKGALQ
jgi:hypothetical protein